MEQTPKTSASTLDDHKENFLSATFETSGSSSTRDRSSSSAHSFVSNITEVGEIDQDFDLPVLAKQTKFKTITSDVEIKLTVWECIKLLNPFGKRVRTVYREFQVTNIDESDGEDEPCPWIRSVFVLTQQKDQDGRFIQKEARATIDTGCHQGNFVSKKFLLEQLGIPESAFQDTPLKAYERQGISMTGDLLVPEGALRLDWYDSESTKVYRRMRFLVSSNQHCDLVIGAKSIKKCRILPAPNLAQNIVDVDDSNEDPRQQELRGIVKTRKNTVLSCRRNLKEAKTSKNDVRIDKCTVALATAEAEVKTAETELKKYETQKSQQAAIPAVPKPANKLNASPKGAQNAARQRTAPKHYAPAPVVTITDQHGLVRRVTGYSVQTLRHTGGVGRLGGPRM